VRLPGIYPPQHDTALLISALRASGLAPGRRVLDICTGTGAVAVAAAALGAAAVTAVDLSRRSILNVRANSVLQGARVIVRRGDLFAPLGSDTFDLVVCNPPYVPAASATLSRHTRRRSWDGGLDGRLLVDRICAGVSDVLRPGGRLLMTHTAVIDTDQTLDTLATHGLEGRVVRSATVPFGPVMTERIEHLTTQGLIPFGQRTEELVVIEASMADAVPHAQSPAARLAHEPPADSRSRLAG
jgi:release factor glutamine methyltransferase